MITKINAAQNNSKPAFGMTYSGKTLLSAEDEIAMLIKYSKKALAGEISATKMKSEEKFYKSISGEDITMETPACRAVGVIEIKAPETEDILILNKEQDLPEVKKEYKRLADILYLETKKVFFPESALGQKKQTWWERIHYNQ